MQAGEHPDSSTGQSLAPPSIWLSLLANTIGFCAGAVFLFAPARARFRGMEPEAWLFVALSMIATLLGLLALATAIFDLFRRGDRLWGIVAGILALTPLPVAALVSGVIADMRGIVFD